MNFIKMHGTGNDFVIVDGRENRQDWSVLAQAMCQAHYGIGGDGILVIEASKTADFKMRMLNPDGSESEMCGNGIRCVTKYIVDEGLSQGRGQLQIETIGGIREVTAKLGKKGGVDRVRVGMGPPHTRPQDIPVATMGPGPIVDFPLIVEGQSIPVTCLSMGNPHAVAFIDEPVSSWPLDRLGPMIEHHEFFPRRVNFEIVNVKDRGHLEARVWERGAGMTLACGTGACAVAVAAWLQGRVEDSIDVSLPGGTLHVDWDGSSEVWLEGPVEAVFRGEWLK